MYRRTIVFCLVALFVLASMTQLSFASHKVWRPEPAPVQKVRSPQTATMVDTLLFENFEGGVLPAGWQTVDNLEAIHWRISGSSSTSSVRICICESKLTRFASASKWRSTRPMYSPRLPADTITGPLAVIGG